MIGGNKRQAESSTKVYRRSLIPEGWGLSPRSRTPKRCPVGASPIRTEELDGRGKPDPDRRARRSGQARAGQKSTKEARKKERVSGGLGLVPTLRSFGVLGRQSGVRSGQARAGQRHTAVGASPSRTEEHGGRGEWVFLRKWGLPTLAAVICFATGDGSHEPTRRSLRCENRSAAVK